MKSILTFAICVDIIKILLQLIFHMKREHGLAWKIYIKGCINQEHFNWACNLCEFFFAAVNVSHKSKVSSWLLAKCVENIFQRLQLIINTIQEVEHGGNHSCIQNRLKQIEGHFIWHSLSSTPGFHPLSNVHKIQF